MIEHAVLFYGFEVTDRTKAEQLVAAEDHAEAMWKTRSIEEPYVPHECEFSNGHKCPMQMLNMWDYEYSGISNGTCKLVRYGDLNSYTTSRVAIAITDSAYGDLEELKGKPTNRRAKKGWTKYLREFAANLGVEYNKPTWLDEKVLL